MVFDNLVSEASSKIIFTTNKNKTRHSHPPNVAYHSTILREKKELKEDTIHSSSQNNYKDTFLWTASQKKTIKEKSARIRKKKKENW